MKDDVVLLHHILDAIAQIEQYVADANEDSFYHHRMMQDAVVRQLEIIGEASRHLSEPEPSRAAVRSIHTVRIVS